MADPLYGEPYVSPTIEEPESGPTTCPLPAEPMAGGFIEGVLDDYGVRSTANFRW